MPAFSRVLAIAVVAIAAVAAVVLFNGHDASSGSGPGTTREFSVTIAGRAVSPPLARADIAAGSAVRITVTSDAPDELHVHGYDRRATLNPGVPATVEFRADTPGLFEVETHGSGLVLLQLAVR